MSLDFKPESERFGFLYLINRVGELAINFDLKLRLLGG